jgi:hypothetical protein
MKRILLLIVHCSLLIVSASAQNILTPSHGWVNAGTLKVGDTVVGSAANNIIRSIETWRPVTDTENQGVFRYYLINNKYRFYKNQDVVANRQLMHAFELQVGDTLRRTNGTRFRVTTIVQYDTATVWYRLKLSGDRTYYLDSVLVHNATRFWVGGGSSANWSATSNTNWSGTTGGSNNATVPGSADDVTFDGAGASGNSASTVSATITVLSLTFSSGYTNTVTLNAVPTIAGNFTDNTAHSWAGGATITISAASTITSGGKTFPNGVTFSGSNTKTLSGNWTIGGALVCATATTTINKTASEVLSCAGLTINGTTAGTINITLTGGTWSGTSGNTISGTVTIAGDVTVSGSINYSTGTLTYSSGSVTTTSSTITIGAATTLNTNGITWNTVAFTAAVTYTINSLLSAATITMNSNNMTFAGTAGFTTATLTISAISNIPITFKNGVTYTVTSAFNFITSNPAGHSSIVSDDATLKAIFTLSNGATCNVGYVNFTRIDASAGRTIWSFNGTITSCLNINSFTDLKTVSKTFVQ